MLWRLARESAVENNRKSELLRREGGERIKKWMGGKGGKGGEGGGREGGEGKKEEGEEEGREGWWGQEREQDKEKSQSGLEMKWQHIILLHHTKAGGPC